jgi:hypothetical protein
MLLRVMHSVKLVNSPSASLHVSLLFEHQNTRVELDRAVHFTNGHRHQTDL